MFLPVCIKMEGTKLVKRFSDGVVTQY